MGVKYFCFTGEYKNMDSVYEMALLIDFYGQMLTKRQFDIMDLHFNSDYSLGEIAQQLNISRQGVHDNIKRSKALLKKMEVKLGLVDRFNTQKNKEERILKYLEDINKSNMSEEDIAILKKIEDEIKNV
ncbi:UNVERIFIED_CONTAM: hypothetical protein Cloal_0647 [Acetivibrio alkalicellulosi]